MFQSVRRRLMKQRRFRELLVASISLAFFLGIIVVPVESNAPEASIRTISDGLWWSVQTLTTVGYGDVVPHTIVGRGIGVAMQLLGTVMFGTMIAIISSSMSRNQEEFYWGRLFTRLEELDKKITDVEKRITFIVKDNVPSDSNTE